MSTTTDEEFSCSHDGCGERLPGSHQGHEIPPGWTISRVEEHHADTISLYYVYLCPRHKLTSTDRQTNLFPLGETA